MGTYMIGNKEIKEAVTEALDSLEGDFTRGQLLEVLPLLAKKYKWVCDE